MLEIKEYTAEYIKDPFGILSGSRYEFVMDLVVPEEDELFCDHGVYLRVLFLAEEAKMIKYDFYERGTDKYLDFEMDEDEEEQVRVFCMEHLPE